MTPSQSPDSAGMPSRMSSTWLVLILSLLLGTQPITTDLYLPALPSMMEVFGAPVSQAQLTLTSLLLAFGTSQLVWGPMSDRFGRRPILLWGLGAYTAASVGCALAASLPMLLLWRVVQGAAMGAAVMCARAVVRDLFTPENGARVLSKGLSGLGVIACLSAPLGGFLTDTLGWRYALGALVVFGAAAWLTVAFRFTETVTVRNPQALQPATLFSTWLAIIRHPTFLTWSALSTASYAGLFTFLATSSFVFIKTLGVTRTQYGLLMFTMCVVYLTGTFMCRRLLPRHGLRRTAAIAGAISLTGGTLLGVLAWAGVYTVWAIMLPYCVFMLAHGVHQPLGQSGAVGPFPRAAGAASALNGFLMMLTAFVAGGWVGMRLDDTVFALTNGVWFWSVCIALVCWVLVPRYGVPRQVQA